jgi:uncharacterized protein YbjT (DUF2867 family)
MKMEHVVLVGGTGFLGQAMANRLAQQQIQVTVITRRRSRAAPLLLLPTVRVIQADPYDVQALIPHLAGADALINFVGVLHSREGTPFGPDFERAHVRLPALLVQAAQAAGVQRLLHISALGASEEAPSGYLRSKAAGEKAIQAFQGDWTVLRPSVVFGPHDAFLNLFARLSQVLPLIALGRADARLQPVYVGDVIESLWQCLGPKASEAAQKTLDLAGPQSYSLAELVRYAATLQGRSPWVVPLPLSLASLSAFFMEFLPNPPMSRDNLRSLSIDSLPAGAPLPFGLTPTPLETVAPLYLDDRLGKANAYSRFCQMGRTPSPPPCP